MSSPPPSEVVRKLQDKPHCLSVTLDKRRLYTFPDKSQIDPDKLRVDTYQAVISAELLVGSDRDVSFVRHKVNRILLDSGADTTILPFDWALERDYDLREIKKGNLEYLTADQDILSSNPSDAKLEDLAEEGRVLRAYRKLCYLTIGNSGEYKIPVLFCDGKVPAILGREGVFDHFYFGLCARLTTRKSQWLHTQFGDVTVWENERLFPDDWRNFHSSVPTIDVSWMMNSKSKTISMAFDSGAEISVYDKQKAESSLGIDFSIPPTYERQAALLTRTMGAGKGRHFQPGEVKGPVKQISTEIASKKLSLWTLFPSSGPHLAPLLGCASVLDRFFVGFGCGPTIAVPVEDCLAKSSAL